MPRRPASCTPERIEVIIDALKRGNTRKTAANLAGVSADMLKTWLTQMPDFKTLVERAEAELQDALVTTLYDSATSGPRKSWQAAITMLSRRDPMAWGDIQRFEVYQKIDEIEQVRQELAQAGVNVTMQQLISDMEQIQRAGKSKKGRNKRPTIIDVAPALPEPGAA